MSRSKGRHKSTTSFKRRRGFRDVKESFLIICLGENTEPIYFRSFHLSSADIRTISYPHHGNVLNFVREAIKTKRLTKGDYDNYWVVFDKGENTGPDFNTAIKLAEENGFNVAYSNQAFEFWFILHFNYHCGTMPRETYKEKLDKKLGFDYTKEKAICIKLYKALLARQSDAISNAERVYNIIGDHSNPASEESSTTVHELVKSLNKFL